MTDPNGNQQARLEANVQNMAQLIDYQQGSIVSRQILNKKTGTVTLFAFDAGESLSEHTAPYDALVNIIEGSAEVTIAQKPFQLRCGEMIVMPANQPHAVKAIEKFKMLLIMIRS